MRKFGTTLSLIGAALLLGACEDPLSVENKNNPDVQRAYSKPGDIESLIQGLYQQIHGVMVNVPTEGGIVPQVAALSTESYGTVANYGMALRNAIPRVAIQNGRGNQTGEGTFRDFREFSKLARSAANGIIALDNLGGAGLGSPGRNARARSAILRSAHRTSVIARGVNYAGLGVPRFRGAV